MAPKSSAGKEKLLGDEDEVLQAVILADSFNKRFRPLTTRKPRCLLPICNAPLLDWTFESLALAGVQEIFVICRSHAEQVKSTIAESRWSKPGSGIKIMPIMTAKETFSPGDAMRDIYTRGLVTGDFVLVMGDLVSNVKINEVVKAHKERRKTNKDAIMTMVVKESGSRHRTRPTGNSSVFVIDSETSECLHYEPVMGYPPTKVAGIPREILAEHPEVEIRNDLIDCSIDICSVEVPSLFQDNFDYLDIRRDFVHGVLTSDLLMKNIYCYVAKEGYAARVQDTKSYQSISKDILSRWTFPLVPDNNHPAGDVYEHRRGNKYIAKDGSVVLARTSRIGNNCLIGPSTQVSEDVQITSSVIGRNCVIGSGSIIDNSYIFDGTIIGAGCVVEHSIVGAGVEIRENSRVGKGCLVGDGVVIGPEAVLERFEKLSKKRETGDDGEQEDEEEDVDSEEEEIEANQEDSIKAQLGSDCNAIVWPREAPDEDEDEEGVENYKNQRFLRLGLAFSTPSTSFFFCATGDDASDLEFTDEGSLSSDEDSDSSDEDSDSDANFTTLPTSSATSLTLENSTIVAASDAVAESEFRAEVEQSLERAFAEGHSVDNAAVELKTLRMASNVPLSRVRESVVSAIVEKIQIVEGGGVPQRQEIAKVINRWGPLIDKIGGVDAVETVSILQTHCATSERLPLFAQILVALYQADIVEEVDMRRWHALPSSKGAGEEPGPRRDGMKKCWDVGAALLEQLSQQESDSDEDSEGDDDDGDDDEEEEDEEEELRRGPRRIEQLSIIK
ncbi:nucleotide-diphospho-sugar transferase [Dendrothele bispora CBS 962.96]|uniref:Translation initiation factor eIF2B subunit epsilon n=1 Tax=Dendrothele bispora (strain CBS 962.96) TaxID=1314807 RepID=A0A4S8LC36_DENBC|nr:nucleotide-diphospho-sugar transferase [Dendrothele bispora CBS 962.96]